MTKITIVEDDKAIRDMYRFKLEAEGYEISLAEDGKIGKEVIANVKHDLLFLDIKL